MGRLAAQAKRRKRSSKGHRSKHHQTVDDPPSAGNPSTHDRSASPFALVTESDIETTVSTLDILCQEPTELAKKNVKDVKRAVYALQSVMAQGMTIGASLTSRISAALKDYRFTDALILLFEMYTRRLPPKLGSLQRWVRDCDATISLDGTIRDPDALRCLDLILRISSPRSIASSNHRTDGTGDILKRKPAWCARGEMDGEIAIWEKIRRSTLFDTPPISPYPNFRVVQYTPGHLRKPPNLYGSTVYASSPDAIRLTPAEQRPRKATRVDVPGLPGCFMVLDVFTPEECLQIVQAATAIGLEKDEAASGSAYTQASILARNFIWLADMPFLQHFYQQIVDYVPHNAPYTENGNGGGSVRGINARFRVYQYEEHQVYRPHIDGAWPAAGLDSVSGEYLHDSSPPSDPLWSRYTLLVYLNSDIPEDTGCTTFFLPSKEFGVMETTSVKPIQGAVLCFPHGDAEGSLLHEGSAVGHNGGKLVIRTDLLYEARGFGQYKPPASVGVINGGREVEGLGG